MIFSRLNLVCVLAALAAVAAVPANVRDASNHMLSLRNQAIELAHAQVPAMRQNAKTIRSQRMQETVLAAAGSDTKAYLATYYFASTTCDDAMMSVNAFSLDMGGCMDTVAQGMSVSLQLLCADDTFSVGVYLGSGCENPYTTLPLLNNTIVGQCTMGDSMMQYVECTNNIHNNFASGPAVGLYSDLNCTEKVGAAYYKEMDCMTLGNKKYDASCANGVLNVGYYGDAACTMGQAYTAATDLCTLEPSVPVPTDDDGADDDSVIEVNSYYTVCNAEELNDSDAAFQPVTSMMSLTLMAFVGLVLGYHA